jgi:hypothetical protein
MKGGKTGINVVVMGLSWWVMAQCDKRDVNAWFIVDDLKWVIQEMKRDKASPLTPQKRPCDTEDEGEERPKKRYDYLDLFITVTIIDLKLYI